MRKTLLAFVFSFLFVGSAHAVQYSSVFLTEEENDYFGSIAPCVTQTIHTERIEQDRLGATRYVSVLRNLERMVRSAEEGCGFQMPKLWDAVDRVNFAVNNGYTVPVYGASAEIMGYFVSQGFRYAGK